MKKLALALFFWILTASAFASCSVEQAQKYGLDSTTVSTIQAREGDQFYCWELDYLIKTGQTDLSVSAYTLLVADTVKKLFPHNSNSPKTLRLYGSIHDFEKLAILKKIYSVSSDDFDKIIHESSPSFLKFYPFIYSASTNTIVNQTKLKMGASPCLSSADFSKLAAPYGILSKPIAWDGGSGSFVNIFGTSLAKITAIKDETNAILEQGVDKTPLLWNSKNCKSLTLTNEWSKSFADIASVVFLGIFDSAGTFIDKTFNEFADLGKSLLGVFMTLWIVLYIFKRSWNFDEPFNVASFMKDLWKLILFSSFYLSVLIFETPAELVRIFLTPILEIGAYFGKIVFETAFGYALPIADATILTAKAGVHEVTKNIIEPLYTFISAFNTTSLLPFSVAESLIGYGWKSLEFSSILAGFGILVIFGWVWVKMFVMLIEMMLDLVIILILYPLLALAYVFPITRPSAQTAITTTIQIGMTLAFYPILTVFTSRMTMAFLTQSDPLTKQSVDQLLRAGDIEGLARTFDMSFSLLFEGFFVGLLLIYVIKNAPNLIGQFTSLYSEQKQAENTIKDYQNHWKKVETLWKGSPSSKK